MQKLQTVTLALFLLASTCTLLAQPKTTAAAPPKAEDTTAKAPAAKTPAVAAPVVTTPTVAPEKKAPPALTVHSSRGTIFPLMVPALLAIILVLLLYIRQLQQEKTKSDN